jgi:predicted GIY-YIG superfamily endonuclease
MCKHSSGAYESIIRNNWQKELFKHMTPLGHLYKRSIYAFEFSDNFVYVGLSKNIQERKEDHLKRNKEIKSKVKIGKYIFKQLTDYLPNDQAIKKENYFLNKYKKEGWILLNKIKGGSLCGFLKKWDREKCLIEAEKYKNRNYSDFIRKSNGAYEYAHRNNLLDEIKQIIKLKSRKWTDIQIIKEAQRYNSKKEFRENSPSAYTIMHSRKLSNFVKYKEYRK